MSFFDDLLQSALPSFHERPTLPLGKKVGEFIKLLLEIGGLWELLDICLTGGYLSVAAVLNKKTNCLRRTRSIAAKRLQNLLTNWLR